MTATILEWLDNEVFEANARVMAAFFAEHPEYGTNPRPSYAKHDGEATVFPNFVNGEGDTDRYVYDFTRCTSEDGWKQYDTKEDASYFGVWYHAERKVTVTYAEGDETVVVCRTEAAWKAELTEMAEFYGAAPPMAIGIGNDGSVTHYFDEDARPEL